MSFDALALGLIVFAGLHVMAVRLQRTAPASGDQDPDSSTTTRSRSAAPRANSSASR